MPMLVWHESLVSHAPRIYKNGGRQSAPEADCQRSMIVLLMIRGTCAGFRAKNVQVSGHLPPLLAWRYRIMALVGEGGFGAVYKAEDVQRDGALVALKQINLSGLCPRDVIEATETFNREVGMLSGLKHPNLPRIYK